MDRKGSKLLNNSTEQRQQHGRVNDVFVSYTCHNTHYSKQLRYRTLTLILSKLYRSEDSTDMSMEPSKREIKKEMAGQHSWRLYISCLVFCLLCFSSSVIFLLVDACVGLNWLLVSFLSHVNKKHHSFILCRMQKGFAMTEAAYLEHCCGLSARVATVSSSSGH